MRRWFESLLARLGLLSWAYRAALPWVARRRGLALRWLPGSTEIRRGRQVLRVPLAARDPLYLAVRNALCEFDNFFETLVPDAEGDDAVVDCSTLRRHTMRRSGMEFYFTNLPEPETTTEQYLERAALKPGDVVFDLGAFCGTQTVRFAQAVGPAGKVLALEPDPASFTALQKNLELHRATNAVAWQRGAWSRSGTLEFQASGTISASFVGRHKPRAGTVTVPVVSLTDAFAELGWSRLDFIKMDIEGAELEVLAAARELIAAHRPRAIVENHLGERGTAWLREFFGALGYRIELLPQTFYADLPLLFAAPPER